MKEADWLASSDPSWMLGHHRCRAPFEERKLRLFAAACCRKIWEHLDEQDRLAIEVMERFVDGKSSSERMAEVVRQAIRRDQESKGSVAIRAVTLSISGLDHEEVPISLIERIDYAVSEVAAVWQSNGATHVDCVFYDFSIPGVMERVQREHEEEASKRRNQQLILADLLREIIGNPFWPILFYESWRTPDVMDMAREISRMNRFQAMPILGDALEEAGCDLVDLLEHLRRSDGHVRGCWALDAVLGRGRLLREKWRDVEMPDGSASYWRSIRDMWRFVRNIQAQSNSRTVT